MGISSGITASLAGRYAYALYELASEQGAVTTVEGDLERLVATIGESADLADLIDNPRISRDAAIRAIAGVAGVLGLSLLTSNFLGVLAGNRRLPALRGV
ncbi:F0F1 ATP synthase subunit delta, partial [Enterococcus faecalis]|uniref:F0F1 ATP synthase subunit delta n=1 Tax=Enterococcus faecalis TaxID=1351 RepID=UPI00403FAD5D